MFLGSSFIAEAQDQVRQDETRFTGNQFYAEFGGPGAVFSANFDFRFSRAQQGLGLGLRIGMGYGIYVYGIYDRMEGMAENPLVTISYITIPVGINYVFGKTKSPHAFEIGAGATVLTRRVPLFCYDNENEAEKFGNVVGHTSFMYRRKPIDGGFTWRIGFTPMIGTSGDFYPSGAIGLGYSF